MRDEKWKTGETILKEKPRIEEVKWEQEAFCILFGKKTQCNSGADQDRGYQPTKGVAKNKSKELDYHSPDLTR